MERFYILKKPRFLVGLGKDPKTKLFNQRMNTPRLPVRKNNTS